MSDGIRDSLDHETGLHKPDCSYFFDYSCNCGYKKSQEKNMNLNEYQRLAMRSESPRSTAKLTVDGTESELLNAALGLADEAGEFAGHLKKFLFHGHEMGWVDFVEEAGDVMWYLAQAANALGISLEEIAARNIEKLKIRYPEKFEDHQSINRDLVKEYAAFLEAPNRNVGSAKTVGDI